MNRGRYIGIVWALSCGIGALAVAQDAGTSREADHQALRQLRAKVIAAVNSQDVNTLTSVFAKEFVLTTVDQTVLTNKEGFAAYYERMFKDAKAPIVKMQTTVEADVLTRFTGPDAGYCYGSALATYTLKDGRVFNIKERWTALVVKEGAEWKLAAAHTGVDFLDNPVLRVASMSLWRKMAIWMHLAKPPTD